MHKIRKKVNNFYYKSTVPKTREQGGHKSWYCLKINSNKNRPNILDQRRIL